MDSRLIKDAQSFVIATSSSIITKDSVLLKQSIMSKNSTIETPVVVTTHSDMLKSQRSTLSKS